MRRRPLRRCALLLLAPAAFKATPFAIIYLYGAPRRLLHRRRFLILDIACVGFGGVCVFGFLLRSTRILLVECVLCAFTQSSARARDCIIYNIISDLETRARLNGEEETHRSACYAATVKGDYGDLSRDNKSRGILTHAYIQTRSASAIGSLHQDALYIFALMPPSHTPRAPQRIASLSRSKLLSTTQGRASSLNHNIIIIIILLFACIMCAMLRVLLKFKF